MVDEVEVDRMEVFLPHAWPISRPLLLVIVLDDTPIVGTVERLFTRGERTKERAAEPTTLLRESRRESEMMTSLVICGENKIRLMYVIHIQMYVYVCIHM